MNYIAAALCLFTLTGCSVVVMREPFPETRLSADEQEQLEGTWVYNDSVVQLRFTSNGIPWLAGMEWQNDDFRLEKTRLRFSRYEDVLYVCMPVDDAASNRFSFAEIKTDGDTAYLWGPNVEYIAGVVGSGRLKGTVEKDSYSTAVSIESPSVQLLALLAAQRNDAIDYRNPLVLRRIK